MEIKILGTGCSNCKILENNTHLALEKSWIKANVTKVTEFEEIMNYDILSTPWFVLNEKVISSGKVLNVDEIVEILKCWEKCSPDETLGKCGCSCKSNC